LTIWKQKSGVMIISICNFKGGVAKTCSSMNIGAAMANMGHKTLLIDLDPQFNLSTSMGIVDPPTSIYDVLLHNADLPIHTLYDGLDIIPSSIDLNKAEVELAGQFKREEFLGKALQAVESKYDYILIDCPPSLGLLTINALVASDKIFVPVEAEYLALKGYSVLEQALGQIGMTLDGIFVTKYDGRTVLHRDIVEALREHAGERVFTTVIRTNIAIPEATANGTDIFRYNASCNGAKDYKLLTEEMIAHGKD